VWILGDNATFVGRRGFTFCIFVTPVISKKQLIFEFVYGIQYIVIFVLFVNALRVCGRAT